MLEGNGATLYSIFFKKPPYFVIKNVSPSAIGNIHSSIESRFKDRWLHGVSSEFTEYSDTNKK